MGERMSRGAGSSRYTWNVCVLIAITLFSVRGNAGTFTLEEAVALARRGNPLLAASDAQIRSATEKVGRAFAPYLPSINLAIAGRWDGGNTIPAQTLDPMTMMPVLSYPFLNGFRATASGQFDERIWDFGRTSGQVGAARATVKQTQIDRITVGLDVELAVFEAYNDALRGRAQEEVQRIAVEQVEKQLQRATALYKATLRPEIDVLSAETQLAQARIGQLKAKNATANALIALRAAIGLRAPVQIELAEFQVAVVAEETRERTSTINAAIDARPEIHSLEQQIEATQQTVRAARGDYFPVFSLSANATLVASDSYWGPAGTLFGSFTITQPLFTGWATRHAVADARAIVDVVRANLEQQRLTITQEVLIALQAVDLARASLEVATIARQQAERQLTLAQGRYESKIGTFVELNDARNGVINAMAQEIDARYGLSKGRGELLRRLGRSVVKAP
jgi:outer membrane protein